MQASLSWRQTAARQDGPVQGVAENDRTEKANELTRSLVGTMKKGGDIIVISGSKSKLWREVSLKRSIQNSTL